MFTSVLPNIHELIGLSFPMSIVSALDPKRYSISSNHTQYL